MDLNKIMPEQIAKAFGVPPEMVGLLPPGAGEQIEMAAFDGTLTGEAYVFLDGGKLDSWGSYTPGHLLTDQEIHAGDWDGEVLPIGQCPSNTTPYVPGHLEINSMLVNQQPTGWESKTSAEILADIQKAADSYKQGKPMPKKVFHAKEPGEGSGIPAHAVFTSPLIHTSDEAKEKAKKLLKTTGDVKVQQLDEHGQPTGKLITLGQIQDFHLDGVMNPNDYKLAQGWPPEPQTIPLNYADVPEGYYIKEDPDYGEQLVPVPEPDTLSGPYSTTHHLAHGATLIEYPDGMSTLDLPGTVHTPGEIWSHKLHGKFTLATPLARKIAGLDPDPNPQISMASTTQWVAGTPAVWSHQHGWQLISDVSTGPTTWYGEDGQPLPDGDDLLTEEPKIQIPDDGDQWKMPTLPEMLRYWCTWHDQHGFDPTHLVGKVWQCGSSAHSRASTPLEDKQVLSKIRMLHDTGLI